MDVGFVYQAADGTRATLCVPPKVEVPTVLKVRRAGEVIDLQRISEVPR
ncbi:hypothetical protein [Subtercola sp. RTI3]|nr:hypothetical protein [Subtercola sp. RTI3]MEA9983675.1 hypothetical protein [Subtercola sp. RTI3]